MKTSSSPFYEEIRAEDGPKGSCLALPATRYPSMVERRKRQQWFSKSCLPLAHDIRRLPLDLFRIDNKTETENGRWIAREEEACSFVAADCPEGSLPSTTTYSPELHAGFGSKFTLLSCRIQLQVYCMTSSYSLNQLTVSTYHNQPLPVS